MGWPVRASSRRHFTECTHITQSHLYGLFQLCQLGLGGFTHGGRGWRLEINPILVTNGNDISNNILEFLGMVITLWLSLIECKELGLVNELILILGDNIGAIHWIIKSSLSKTSVYWSAIIFITRKIAKLVSELIFFCHTSTPTRYHELNRRLVVI